MRNGEYYSKFDQSEKIFYCVAHSFSFLLIHILKLFIKLCVCLLSTYCYKIEALLCVASCCWLVLKFTSFDF
jgi:hypothetical protein